MADVTPDDDAIEAIRARWMRDPSPVYGADAFVEGDVRALLAALDARTAETAEIAAALGMPGRATADVAQGARNLLANEEHYRTEWAALRQVDALRLDAVCEARAEAQRERERAEAAENSRDLWRAQARGRGRQIDEVYELAGLRIDAARREAIEEAIRAVEDGVPGDVDTAPVLTVLRALLTREAPSTDDGTAGEPEPPIPPGVHIGSKGCADRYTNTVRGTPGACACPTGRCWVTYARAEHAEKRDALTPESWAAAGYPGSEPPEPRVWLGRRRAKRTAGG